MCGREKTSFLCAVDEWRVQCALRSRHPVAVFCDGLVYMWVVEYLHRENGNVKR